MKKYLVIAMCVMIAGTIFTYKNFTANADEEYEQFTITCILKSRDGVWSILDNDAHDNDGCGYVVQQNNRIQVYYDNITFDTIVGGHLSGDQRTNAYPVFIGDSVQASRIEIYLQNTSGTAVNPATVTSYVDDYTNIFVSVVGRIYAD